VKVKQLNIYKENKPSLYVMLVLPLFIYYIVFSASIASGDDLPVNPLVQTREPTITSEGSKSSPLYGVATELLNFTSKHETEDKNIPYEVDAKKETYIYDETDPNNKKFINKIKSQNVSLEEPKDLQNQTKKTNIFIFSGDSYQGSFLSNFIDQIREGLVISQPEQEMVTNTEIER